MAREFPKIWKDCILKLLNEGVDGYPNRGKWDKSNQKEAAIYISMEARRLGDSMAKTMDLILEWNQEKNDPPLPKTKILTDVVSYVYEQNPPPQLGCKRQLVRKGYCLRERGGPCKYWEELTKRQKPPDKWEFNDFDRNGWPEYLRKCYKNGELLIRIYYAIRIFAADKLLSQKDPIMIGVRTIRKLIIQYWKDINPSLMSICSALHILEDCGLLVKLESGAPGDHSRRSNVYRIIYPIPRIPDLPKEEASNLYTP